MSAAQDLRCVVVAPHVLAAEAGKEVLREGGNAIEAMLAAAAVIAVVYPHMNGIGGDGFWTIRLPDGSMQGIDASGTAGAGATPEFYLAKGVSRIPARGSLALNTVAGTVAGWAVAADLAKSLGGNLPLPRLLEPAIEYAHGGAPVSPGQHRLATEKLHELYEVEGFAGQFTTDGWVPPAGHISRNRRLAATLKTLAEQGLDTFYRGELARLIARDLESVGSLLTLRDLNGYEARRVTPLALRVRGGEVFNLPPPTQGVASLMILGILDRLSIPDADGFRHVHACVEATKKAFQLRDREVADPAVMQRDAGDFLRSERLDRLAASIDLRTAAPWQAGDTNGDTVWLGATDSSGCSVSFIQSLFWEFGSGVVLPESGILWQNRGAAFTLELGRIRCIAPGRRPFHTLNPAIAKLDDGRVFAYGTMGGDGQPQTQAAIFTRYVGFGQPLSSAIDAPRWLLGRTWGSQSATLKLESRFDPALADELRSAGHDVELLGDFDQLMGHAGAVVRHANGRAEGAADPRSDGAATGL